MNNEKRLLLAITLSLLIVSGWSFAISKLYPQKKQAVTETMPVAQVAQESRALILPSWQVSSQISLPLPGQDIEFSLPYATLNKTIFKDYQNSAFDQTIGFLLPDKDLIFHATQTGHKITFESEDAHKRIIKEISPLNSKYNMELGITIENLGSTPLNLDYPLVIGEVSIQNGHFSERLKEVFFGEKDKTVHMSPFKNYNSPEAVKFAGFRDRYFCVVVQPDQPGYTGYVKKLGNNVSEMGLKYPLQIMPGQTQRLNFHIYLGPQELQLLKASNEEWASVVYYGVFDPIARS